MTMICRKRTWQRHSVASMLALAALLSAEIAQANLQIHAVVDGLTAAHCCRERCHHSAATHCGGDCCTIGAPQPDASAVLSKKPAPAANPLRAAASVAGAASPRWVLACRGPEPDPRSNTIPVYLLHSVLRI